MTVDTPTTRLARPQEAREPSAEAKLAERREQLENDVRAVDRGEADAETWTRIAVARTFFGLHEEAVDAFKHALALGAQSDRTGFWWAMGQSAARSGHWEEALQAFEEVTRRNPDQPIEWILKSMVLENLGQPEQANAALRQAAAQDPSKRDNIIAIAFALGLLGRYDEALVLDEQAIELDPTRAFAFANKGTHLGRKAVGGEEIDQELVDQADAAFAKAVELAPDDATIRRNYGVMLGEVGRYADARRELQAALELRRGDVATLRSLGFVSTQLDDHEAAFEADSEAARLAPNHPVVWRSLGVDLLNMGRYEEALHAFEEATQRAPERAEMRQAKAAALWRLGQYEEAAKTYEDVVHECGDAVTEAFLGLGASYSALGRDADALKELRRAVGSEAERPELWELLGRTYRRLGNGRAAELAFRRGYELEPSVGMANGIVDALAAQEREAEALEFLRTAAADVGDSATVAYWRGALLMRLGRESEAIAELRTASREWRKAQFQDARSIAADRVVEYDVRPRAGAVSWSDHWFGPGTSRTTRVLGALLLCALAAAFVLPLAATDALGSLDYGAGWAAITLPVTVIVLLLALPSVQTFKAGGGSFEVTTIVLQDRDPLKLPALPPALAIDKIPDLPFPDVHAVADQVSDYLDSLLGGVAAGRNNGTQPTPRSAAG
jgi:tetratricopeptide (TPR) repeat protein